MNRLLAYFAFICVLVVGVNTAQANQAHISSFESPIRLTETNPNGLNVAFDITGIDESIENSSALSYKMTETNAGREVPTFSRMIEVPTGCRAVIRVNQRTSNLNSADAMQVGLQSSKLNDNMLSALSLDPPEAAQVSQVSFMRGHAIATLDFFPYQFVNNNDEEIVENRLVDVEVEFVPDPNIQMAQPVLDPPGSDWAVLFNKLLLNGTHRDDPMIAEFQQNNRGRMLILHQGDDAFIENGGLEQVNIVAEWKRQMGYMVEVVSVDLTQGITPDDIRDDIIRPRYRDNENPLAYVLIFGGNVPNRALYFPSYYSGVGEEGFVGDHYYSLMDDDNIYVSDIAIGRIHVESYTELRGVVSRTVLYEREPYVAEGTEWFAKGLVTAEDIDVPGGSFVPSMIHLCRWMWMHLHQAGYTRVDTLFASDVDVHIEDDVQDAFEDGRSIALSRGWLKGCAVEDAGNWSVVDTRRKNPFAMAITCLSFDIHEHFFRMCSINNPTGPIVDMSIAGLTHSKANNSILGGATVCMYDYDVLNAGLIQSFSKYQLYSDNRYELAEWVEENVAEFVLMGDPTTQIFTKSPFTIVAEHPDQIALSTQGLSVHVVNDNGDVVPDAWVTVMQGDDLHLVCQPGDDGWARFNFDADELVEGELSVTVTHTNSIPHLGVIDVSGGGVDADFTFDNADNNFSFGETVATTITLANITGHALNGVSVRLSSEYPLVNFADDNLDAGNIAANGNTQVSFDMTLDRAAHSGDPVMVQAVVQSGDQSWEHAFTFEAYAPLMQITGNPVLANEFQPGQVARFQPRLENIGDLATPAFTATLNCMSDYVEVLDDVAEYNAINAGENGVPQVNFRVEADDLAIAGNIAQFQLILAATDQQDTYRDTVYFEAMIGEPSTTEPFGPDGYGYLMFDPGDTDWEDKVPTFDWVEINPYIQGHVLEGIELDLDDVAVDSDKTAGVELPFDFRFYGEEFSFVAVNSNGIFSFGELQMLYPDFRNQQIPGIQGPDAMVAVFWQDLYNPLPDERGVFTSYDEENGIFIIEWSRLKIYRDANVDVNQNLVEFQAILYDPSRYPTSTGDGEIKLQYKAVSNQPGDQWDNHYFTVGIKNLDGTDGLEYCYWNHYQPTNPAIENEMALLITTDRMTANGTLSGRVTRREAPDQTLEGVRVRSVRTNIRTFTNAQGEYSFDQIPAGVDNIEFSLDGFNTMQVAVTINQDENVRIDTSLTHPEIMVNQQAIQKSLRPGNFGTTFGFEIENPGNGALDFSFLRRYVNGSSSEFSQTSTVNGTEAGEDDFYLYGCEFIGEELFVTGGKNRRDSEDNTIYVYNHNMELVRQFLQPAPTNRGMRDLAYDGEYLFGGYREESGDRLMQIIGFDTNGNVQQTITPDIPQNQLSEPWAIAYNPNDDTFIVGYQDGALFVLNRNGEIVRQINVSIPNYYMTLRGLAWYQEDNDGMQLYLIDANDDDEIRLAKVDVNTGSGMVVAVLDSQNDGSPSGLCIGYNWERSIVSLALISDGGGSSDPDYISVYEISPDTHFLILEPENGSVGAGTSFTARITMRADDLTEGVYEFGLMVDHNAMGEAINIPITLTVDENSGVEGDEGMPTVFALQDAYPNPFNAKTMINFSMPEAGKVRLAVYDLAGREVARLVDGFVEAGQHQTVFTGDSFASGIYFYRLEGAGQIAVKRMVYMR